MWGLELDREVKPIITPSPTDLGCTNFEPNPLGFPAPPSEGAKFPANALQNRHQPWEQLEKRGSCGSNSCVVGSVLLRCLQNIFCFPPKKVQKISLVVYDWCWSGTLVCSGGFQGDVTCCELYIVLQLLLGSEEAHELIPCPVPASAFDPFSETQTHLS